MSLDSIAPRLPSRYEDLDPGFKGKLRPNPELIALVKQAFQAMQVSGGIRFLPIYGESGSGKSSAAIELGTHLPELKVVKVEREAVESSEHLRDQIKRSLFGHNSGLVFVIDQYEEAAAQKSAIPTTFVEALALLDRGDLRNERVLFLWLTTSRVFQKSLSDATSRNRRILLLANFELLGPQRTEWAAIITETFQFHNGGRSLPDFEVLDPDIEEISRAPELTLGTAIERLGDRLGKYTHSLHDMSTYQVVMLWPVTDGLRITRIQQFTDARQGYKLDWAAWQRQLNADDQRQLPLHEYNRARLYFDVRLVPVAAADLHPLCQNLDDDDFKLHRTYLERFSATHFVSLVSGKWDPDSYSPLRERESSRAKTAGAWYGSVTSEPTKLGKRIAKILNSLNIAAEYEQTIQSPHGKVRADVLIKRDVAPTNVIVELKAFSPDNTMPSTICSAVQTTLRRHANFAGFLRRQ